MFLSAFVFMSCSDDDEGSGKSNKQTEETVFMYMPWSGDIYSYFLENIEAFETAIKNNNGLGGKRFMLFISTNASNAYLIEITYNKGICVRDTLKNYSFSSAEFTTSSGITSILGDMMAAAPAKGYSMIIGCHGMGWIPTSASGVNSYNKKVRQQNANVQQTRFFGHSSDSKYQTDITTLADGIKSAGIKMEYILFDDCYMSNIETAYDLREVTNYLIASTCEIMIEGMPYATIGKSLLEHDYKAVCQGFYAFYSTFSTPCGTIGVTDCSETEEMAYLMKSINSLYPEGLSSTSDIQTLDGYSPTIFFDFGDYVTHLCEDQSLLAAFNEELNRLVPYKANTSTYYSVYTAKQKTINTFSGLTVSDPSLNSSIKTVKTETNWYKATH